MLKYKLVSRANPRKRNEKQFYAQLTGVQTIKRCDFLSLLEKRSSMSSADVKSFLDALEFELMHRLANGISIRLGDLGSFRATIRSVGAVSKKDYDQRKYIKGVNVRFRPSAKWMREKSKTGELISFETVGKA